MSKQTANVKTEDENTILDLENILTNDGQKQKKTKDLKKMGGMFVTDDAGKRYRVSGRGLKEMFSVENGGTQVTAPRGYEMTDDDYARLLPYVENTNKVLKVADKQYRASNRNVFDVVKQTYDALQQEKPEYLKAYKLLVDMDRSTINKIIKIVSNDIIMSNLDKLPVSWGTLCLLTSLKDDKLQSLIDAKTITKSSTQSEIRLVKDGNNNSDDGYVTTTAYPNFMVIDLNVLSLNKKDRLKVEGLLSELTDYGFEIDGVAKEVA